MFLEGFEDPIGGLEKGGWVNNKGEKGVDVFGVPFCFVVAVGGAAEVDGVAADDDEVGDEGALRGIVSGEGHFFEIGFFFFFKTFLMSFCPWQGKGHGLLSY